MANVNMRRGLWVGMGLAALVLVGCARHVSGIYSTDDKSTMKVEFKDGGKATVTIMNSPQDTTYTEDGDTVTVKGPPDLVFKHNSDDSLGGAGLVLKRQ